MNDITLPLDWKPANYNPDFNANYEFEELGYQLELLVRSLDVFADMSNHGIGNTVELNRNDLAGVYLLLRNSVDAAHKRNSLIHKHVCNLWGHERLIAQQALRDQMNQDEILALVENAIESGELLPAMKQWAVELGASNMEALNAFLFAQKGGGDALPMAS